MFYYKLHIIGSTHHGAAVSALRGSQGVQGLVRMTQLSPEQCLIDGTLDGLTSGAHDVKIHLYGDITQGCDRYTIMIEYIVLISGNLFSCGEVYSGSILDGNVMIICDQAYENQPCEHKLHQVIFLLISSIPNRVSYLHNLQKKAH